MKTKLIVLGKNNSEKPVRTKSAEFLNLLEDEVETYYIVIADTGKSYYTLRDSIFPLHQRLGIPIDIMGRSYKYVRLDT